MDRDVDLYPAYLIAKRLGVSRQLVHYWVKSGKLKQADSAADGRALYRYADAVRVDREQMRTPQSRRLRLAS